MRSLFVLFLISLAFAERIWEQGRDQRIHNHHRDEFVDEPALEEEVEDFHGGIPIVEDDVPEWVKLTFADKFIAMGEAEFIELEDVENPQDFEVESLKKQKHHHHHHHHHSPKTQEEENDEYEYFYSDDEGFEFDPARDKLVDSDSERGKTTVIDDLQIDEEGSEEEEERRAQDDVEDDDAELVRAVKAHRQSVELAKSTVPITVAVNEGLPLPTDASSMLEISSFESLKSHARGSRRAKIQSQHQINKHHVSFSTAPVTNQPRIHLGSRYASSGGEVRFNPNDPRFKANDVISFLEEESDDLKLVHEDGQIRAKNHREWLQMHQGHNEDGEDVKLPTMKKHMYSNGIPVADWEVGYVDNVLQQFGY